MEHPSVGLPTRVRPRRDRVTKRPPETKQPKRLPRYENQDTDSATQRGHIAKTEEPSM